MLKRWLLNPNTTPHSWLDYLWTSVFVNIGRPHIWIPVIAAGSWTAAGRNRLTHGRRNSGLMIYSLVLTDAGFWFMLNYNVCSKVERWWYSPSWSLLLLLAVCWCTNSLALLLCFHLVEFSYLKIIFCVMCVNCRTLSLEHQYLGLKLVPI